MKDELIQFETAKLAKEKGFDIACNTHCFISNSNKIKFETSVHRIDWGNRPDIKTIQKYSAPTQSLLQRWIRERHGIEVYATPVVQSKYDNKAYYQWMIHTKSFGIGDTYEEALEIGLLEALKLIKDE